MLEVSSVVGEWSGDANDWDTGGANLWAIAGVAWLEWGSQLRNPSEIQVAHGRLSRQRDAWHDDTCQVP